MTTTWSTNTYERLTGILHIAENYASMNFCSGLMILSNNLMTNHNILRVMEPRMSSASCRGQDTLRDLMPDVNFFVYLFVIHPRKQNTFNCEHIRVEHITTLLTKILTKPHAYNFLLYY